MMEDKWMLVVAQGGNFHLNFNFLLMSRPYLVI